MFVPVSCTSCGKPFQVPESALGKLAPCPWCQAAVTALPVSVPLPDQPAPRPEPKPEPLSLDADSAAKPGGGVAAPPVIYPASSANEPSAPPAPARRVSAATLAIGFAVVVVVMLTTAFVLGYQSGRLPEADWVEFAAPDGSFAAALPGRASEEDLEPVPESSLAGGKRFTARRWYARTTAWVAYHDLDPTLAPKLKSDPSRIVSAGVLRGARDREVTRLGATNTKEAEIRLGAGWGVELHMDTPDGPAVERLILLGEGPHPRLYAFGIQGKNVTPAAPATRRLLGSFRVTE
jgi:hypothetical protein